MACFSSLSSSSSSAAVVANLAHSQASQSHPPSNRKRVTALHSPSLLRNSRASFRLDDNRRRRCSESSRRTSSAAARSASANGLTKKRQILLCSFSEPLKVVISGAPASGKGTQCELIKKKYGLVHIAAGDLLRAEIAAGTENGKRAKEYMEKGMLVPDDIAVMMVKERLLQPDAQENGWLLDGYPRSLSQAKALEDLGIRPDIFILLDVSEESLVDRVVGRRLDPVTGRIYHLKYSPPENEGIAARLTQRFDDTEEKVKLRLQTHHQNVESVLALYKDIIYKVDGNGPKDEVFAEIDRALSSILERKSKSDPASMAGMAH